MGHGVFLNLYSYWQRFRVMSQLDSWKTLKIGLANISKNLDEFSRNRADLKLIWMSFPGFVNVMSHNL